MVAGPLLGPVCLPELAMAAAVTSVDAAVPDSTHSEQRPCSETSEHVMAVIADCQAQGTLVQ